MQSKGTVLVSTALGAALVVFAGCQTSRVGEAQSHGGSAASDFQAQPGPYDDPAHPLQCPTNGDAEPPDGLNGPSFIVRATLLYPFPLEQAGWFGPPFAPTSPAGTPTCATPNPTSTVIGLDRSGVTAIRSDAFQFRNWTDAAACISVYATTIAPYDKGGSMQIAAYVGPFDRSDIAKNNVAASAPGDTAHIAFEVPASTNFEVVVIGASLVDADGNPAAGEAGRLDIDYALYVSNCGQAPDGGGSSSGSASSGGGSSSGGSSSGGSSSGGAEDGGSGGGKSW